MNKKKILVVDDDKTNRKLLKTILSMQGGYEVIEAENGSEALDKLSPDIGIVFLDILMPLLDGMQFLKIIKNEKKEYANIPIIVLTTDDTKKQEALQKGADEVVIKPINPMEILEKAASYL
ncbi:response regulator [Caminibacter mediatlanticus TB-2]|uniref:Response regulator n=1 Tax=Caminibacter mediatlanticus TB-2 TaxID=391592 RepID=A0AAI9F2S7_9BACT|nr:response regulator [Caminibacter mediatlanticus]EDM23901.1 response regulator receiver domain protein (CheY-like) [Caminibacter mediatlanticus TB-2]QCT94268.1 response regulator [Caminibacter mediatlanticus TB-2]